ncbi:PP2C family protein-serine/threonine phosphatase [Streptomyces sp. MMS24-I2-30]|uniref:PP2C family protein-serine/threonine phosphatase n=1 Tax=Streptomyces sp. MMS24-I2-30 TaxID=3351564 RepID=UPI0038969830
MADNPVEAEDSYRSATLSGVPRHRRLQALELLLTEQRFRIARYVAAHSVPGGKPRLCSRRLPRATPDIDSLARKLLDAVPVPITLVLAVPGEGDEPMEFYYVGRNLAAQEDVARNLPPGALPPWAGPVPLFDRYPTLVNTGVPRLLAEAHRSRRTQGPEPAEWPLLAPDGLVIRMSTEVRVIPCADLLLLTWERGQESLMAQEAQRLAGVCWAEWNLGDGSTRTSSGLPGVLGLPAEQPLPGLLDLGRMVEPDSLDELYRSVHDILLCMRVADCDLRLTGPEKKTVRFVAEPVRSAEGPVWAVRAVLHDVSEDRTSRAVAEEAIREARTQRERADAVAQVAERLRSAVLPGFPAELARHGVEAAAVYRPEARAARVGGDWYKTRILPNGKVLIALGDARGHGLDAVTLMAKLRYALAGLAYTGKSVERLTGWLNVVACDDGAESTATAVVAGYHLGRGLLRWTCAGHPLPVLVRDGRARMLDPPPGGPGLPLGVLPREVYRAAETFLRPGDVVLMYSDGLIERRGSDLDRDSSRLLRAVDTCVGGGIPPGGEALDAFARKLVDELTGPHTADDATVLAFRVVRDDTDRRSGA